MKKVPTKKVLTACVCSTCGEKASAQLGTTHFFCKGIKVAAGKRMPSNLKFPNKGTWIIPAEESAPEVKVA
jgi:hypothetical protein